MTQALCASGNYDPDDWYEIYGDPERTKRALRVCGECPVQAECLIHSLENGEEWGIWGAQTPWKRTRTRNRLAFRNGEPSEVAQDMQEMQAVPGRV